MKYCRSKFGRFLNSVSTSDPQTRYELNCKSWRCPVCKSKWAKKWSALIQEALKYAPAHRTLLVNLTTSTMFDNIEIEAAMRYFIKRLRREYGALEYVKIVEYNRRQTQPHFHLIVVFEDLYVAAAPPTLKKTTCYPPRIYKTIQELWRDALLFANPAAPATTVVWCQPPAGADCAASAAYAVGYIAGGKNKEAEEPNESWRGRRITNSKNFFLTKTSILWSAILARWFPAAPTDRGECLLIPKLGCNTTYGWGGSNFHELGRILRNPKIIRDTIVFKYLNLKPPDLVIDGDRLVIKDYYC